MPRNSLGSVLFAAIFALLASGPARGQGLATRKAPLSPRYQAWVAGHQPRGVPGPAGGGQEGGVRIRGYVPPPIDLSHVHGPIFTQGAGEPPYPALFDLRSQSLLTPVKDQGEYGTCWSFACMGSLESSMLRAGLGAFTLSEWHLAYYAYVPFNGSLLRAFTGGEVLPGEDPVFDQGGNDWMSTALLARGTGAVNNQDCPYQLGGYIPSPIPEGDLPNGKERTSVPLEGAMYLFNIDAPTSEADIKYSLTHFGPAVISLDWEDKNFGPDQSTYRDTSATSTDLNHEVCIIGWNDTFEPCRFPAGNRPAAPGAWIVRNSWSRYWGNAGYFYLSYDSKVFDGTVFQGGPRTGRRIYQYDPLGWINSIGLGSDSACCANIFQARGDDLITSVSFYAGAVNTSYVLDLRTGVSGDPATGVSATPPGLPPQMGTLLAPGYHIIPLDRPVPVARGSRFAVLLRLTTPGYAYPIPVQEQEPGYSDSAIAEHGRSFISADGGTWQDLSPDCQGTAVCLKALADQAH
jgi:C1A family cysteine protease